MGTAAAAGVSALCWRRGREKTLLHTSSPLNWFVVLGELLLCRFRFLNVYRFRYFNDMTCHWSSLHFLIPNIDFDTWTLHSSDPEPTSATIALQTYIIYTFLTLHDVIWLLSLFLIHNWKITQMQTNVSLLSCVWSYRSRPPCEDIVCLCCNKYLLHEGARDADWKQQWGCWIGAHFRLCRIHFCFWYQNLNIPKNNRKQKPDTEKQTKPARLHLHTPPRLH